jgi:hypothetical protein
LFGILGLTAAERNGEREGTPNAINLALSRGVFCALQAEGKELRMIVDSLCGGELEWADIQQEDRVYDEVRFLDDEGTSEPVTARKGVWTTKYLLDLAGANVTS